MPTTFYLASESKAKKNGERPIVVSVHIKGTHVLTNIGYTIHPDNWNESTGYVKKGKTNSKGVDFWKRRSRETPCADFCLAPDNFSFMTL